MMNRVNELANSIREKIEKLPKLSEKCCIYRIPASLRGVNKSAYSPCLISIGPFHRNKKKLQPMQQHKFRYFQMFLKRNPKKHLIDYLTFIRECEGEIREYYAETFNLSSKEFCEMVLLDACFIIQFLLVWFFDSADETDCVFKKPSMEVAVLRDMLLLENQLPFFVLDGLYEIAFGDDDHEEEELVSYEIQNPESATDNGDGDDDELVDNGIVSVTDVGMDSMPYFIDLCCRVLVENGGALEKFKGSHSQVLHLFDFLRTSLLPLKLRDPNEGGCDDWDHPPGIERLLDSGVKFEVVKDDDKSLLDIEFSNGVLRIPKLVMEDYTESMFLNLSAFEQCHYHSDSYIVDYVVFMDTIITTLKDVDILMGAGIIVNSLGNTEDMAEIFNTICRGTTYQTKVFYYCHLCKELNAYFKKPWHRWRATLKHDYFSNPWTIISVIVAVVLLILTVIQTICTVMSM